MRKVPQRQVVVFDYHVWYVAGRELCHKLGHTHGIVVFGVVYRVIEYFDSGFGVGFVKLGHRNHIVVA